MPLLARIVDPQPGDRVVFADGGPATVLDRSDADGPITLMREFDSGTISVARGWRGKPWDAWPIDEFEAPPPPDTGSRWRHENGTDVTVTDTRGVGNTAIVTTSGHPWGRSRTNIVVFYGTHDPA